MNALELADELDALFTKADWEEIPNVVAMIRQQADRIAELEKDLHMVERHYDQLDKDVSSKPVAEVIEWEETYGHTFKKRTVSTVKWLENVEVGTKLYTHPVKQLSDEEIIRIYKETDADKGGIREFVRAIIKEITE